MKRIDGLLGLANRAGLLSFGETALISIKNQKSSLLIIASDLNQEKIRQAQTIANLNNVHHYTYLSKDELGRLLGKGQIGLVAIKSSSLGKQMIKLIKEEQHG